MCDDAWGRGRGVFSNVRKRRDLTGILVEWFHRKGYPEDVGKLGFDTATVGGEDRIYFVESAMDEKCRTEIKTGIWRWVLGSDSIIEIPGSMGQRGSGAYESGPQQEVR